MSKDLLIPRRLAALAPICAADSMRYAMSTVQLKVEDDGTYTANATDGHMLVSISSKQANPELVADRGLKFPDVQAVIPKDEPKAVVLINPSRLRALLKSFERMGIETVTMEIRGPTTAIVFRGVNLDDGNSNEMPENTEVVAALMPVTK